MRMVFAEDHSDFVLQFLGGRGFFGRAPSSLCSQDNLQRLPHAGLGSATSRLAQPCPRNVWGEALLLIPTPSNWSLVLFPRQACNGTPGQRPAVKFKHTKRSKIIKKRTVSRVNCVFNPLQEPLFSASTVFLFASLLSPLAAYLTNASIAVLLLFTMTRRRLRPK
jgi:hypothetical protein